MPDWKPSFVVVHCRDFRLLSIGGGADEVMLSIICKYMNTLPKPPKQKWSLLANKGLLLIDRMFIYYMQNNGTCTSLFFTIILNFILHNEDISADLPMYVIFYASWWWVLSDFDIRIMISDHIYFYIIQVIPLWSTNC